GGGGTRREGRDFRVPGKIHTAEDDYATQGVDEVPSGDPEPRLVARPGGSRGGDGDGRRHGRFPQGSLREPGPSGRRAARNAAAWPGTHTRGPSMPRRDVGTGRTPPDRGDSLQFLRSKCDASSAGGGQAERTRRHSSLEPDEAGRRRLSTGRAA